MLYLLLTAAWIVTLYVIRVALTKKRSLWMPLFWLPVLVCLTALVYMNNSLPQTETTLAAELEVAVAELWLIPLMVVMLALMVVVLALGVLQDYKRRRSEKPSTEHN